MKEGLYINAFVKINAEELNINGAVKTLEATKDTIVLCKQIYKSLEINYPKFYKMDKLSKLGFLASEFLLRNEKVDPNTSLIFANTSSSLNTDIKYQKSINDPAAFFPSPSVFVYTLPNIVIGEVCIRHEITGENLFLVSDSFNAENFVESIALQWELGKAEKFVFAWVEVLETSFEVFSCLISPKELAKNLTLNPKNLLHLYKTK